MQAWQASMQGHVQPAGWAPTPSGRGDLAERPKGRFSSSATRCARRTGSSLCRNCADRTSCRSMGFRAKVQHVLQAHACRGGAAAATRGQEDVFSWLAVGMHGRRQAAVGP